MFAEELLRDVHMQRRAFLVADAMLTTTDCFIRHAASAAVGVGGPLDEHLSHLPQDVQAQLFPYARTLALETDMPCVVRS